MACRPHPLTWRIGVARSVLVLDVAATKALLRRAGLQVGERAVLGAAGARLPRVGILGVGAAKLQADEWTH